MNSKELAAFEIAKKITDGQIISVGTGSTVNLAIDFIAERLKKEKLKIQCLATSNLTTQKLSALGITVLAPESDVKIDWGFDGVDAFDTERRAIKGRGGALLREKILADRCAHDYILLADESKFANDILQHAYVPVEVLPLAVSQVAEKFKRLGATEIKLREGTRQTFDGPVITEFGNFIFDVRFTKLTSNLESQIKSQLGVVESGLFTSYATKIIMGTASGLKFF